MIDESRMGAQRLIPKTHILAALYRTIHKYGVKAADCAVWGECGQCGAVGGASAESGKARGQTTGR